ncbi:hypothetical protein QOZ98_002275 [Planomicrobium stackebrandtii]|uniref:Lipoprotein n=1 Tax=Planomicrobium stackebrandtii TaxID=253160 RepID=A0ABU0GVR7_9BACL|nr:hypothetical protein [Planomicrobium stackebrandtii]MDQ0429447.1 hypothetical protein [Planomicrobium stackebrandtii]
MTKKLVYAALLLGVIGLGCMFFYMSQYVIQNEEAAIHKELTDWQSRGEDVEFEFTTLDMVQLDDTSSHVVFFETPDRNVGYAHLIKGWNGKFKINQSGWGTDLVSFSDLKTNKGTYGLVTGKNQGLEIDHIKAESNDRNFSFTFTLPKEENFLVYEKLPGNLKNTFLPHITLYDENGEDLYPMRLPDN